MSLTWLLFFAGLALVARSVYRDQCSTANLPKEKRFVLVPRPVYEAQLAVLEDDRAASERFFKKGVVTPLFEGEGADEWWHRNTGRDAGLRLSGDRVTRT
jgi:hypothetical protein